MRKGYDYYKGGFNYVNRFKENINESYYDSITNEKNYYKGKSIDVENDGNSFEYPKFRMNAYKYRRFCKNSINYFIDSEHRTVTCIIYVSKTDAADLFRDRFIGKGVYLTSVTPKRFFNKTKYVGVAKCNESDEFNELIGKDIAFERAYTKYIGDQHRVHEDIMKKIRNSLDNYEKYLNTNPKYNRKDNVKNIINRNYEV